MTRALVSAAGFAIVAAACATDLGSTAPTEFNGIKYTAAVAEIVSQNGAKQFSVQVTLSNRTAAQQTRTYPLACPVRILLYRTGDNALVYDETRRPCSSTPTGTIVIEAQSLNMLQSGVRFPSTVAGDSLPLTTYRVRAIVMTEGAQEVLLDAGTYALGSG